MKLRVTYVAFAVVLVLVAAFILYRRQNMPLNTIPFSGMGHSLNFSPDGRTLSLCTDSGIILYETATWKQRQVLKEHADYSYWTPDNHLLTFGNYIVGYGTRNFHDNLEITLWDITKGAVIHQTVLPNRYLTAISPNLAMAALSDQNGGEIVSTATGRSLHDFPNQSFAEPHFSPDNRYFASASGGINRDGIDKSGPVFVWDTQTWQEITSPQAHKIQGCCLRFSPNGRILAVGTPKAVTLWDTTTWQAVRIMPAHFRYLFRLQFSADGTRLAGGGRSLPEDKLPNFSWTLWDTRTGKDIYERHYTYFYGFMPSSSVIFSDDGVENLSSLSLWNGENGRKLWSSTGKIVFDHHFVPNIQPALSLDGTLLATATSYDPNMGLGTSIPKPGNALQIWKMPSK